MRGTNRPVERGSRIKWWRRLIARQQLAQAPSFNSAVKWASIPGSSTTGGNPFRSPPDSLRLAWTRALPALVFDAFAEFDIG